MSGLQYRGEPDQWSPLKRNRRDHTLTISWPRPGSKWALVDMSSLQKKIIRNSFFKFANPAALNELAQIHWFKHFQLAKKKEIVIVAEMMSQHCPWSPLILVAMAIRVVFASLPLIFYFMD